MLETILVSISNLPNKSGFKLSNNCLNFFFYSSIRYPPYTEAKLGWAGWIMKEKIKKKGIMSFFPFVVMGAMFGLLFKVGLGRARALKS